MRKFIPEKIKGFHSESFQWTRVMMTDSAAHSCIHAPVSNTNLFRTQLSVCKYVRSDCETLPQQHEALWWIQMKRRKRAIACLDLAAAPTQGSFGKSCGTKKVSKRSFFPDLEELGQNRLTTPNAGY